MKEVDKKQNISSSPPTSLDRRTLMSTVRAKAASKKNKIDESFQLISRSTYYL